MTRAASHERIRENMFRSNPGSHRLSDPSHAEFALPAARANYVSLRELKEMHNRCAWPAVLSEVKATWP